jgi:hypothetical protein
MFITSLGVNPALINYSSKSRACCLTICASDTLGSSTAASSALGVSSPEALGISSPDVRSSALGVSVLNIESALLFLIKLNEFLINCKSD